MTTRKASRAKAAPVEPSDLETRVVDQHHQALRLWLRLLACTNKIENEIRTQAARASSTPRCRAST